MFEGLSEEHFSSAASSLKPVTLNHSQCDLSDLSSVGPFRGIVRRSVSSMDGICSSRGIDSVLHDRGISASIITIRCRLNNSHRWWVCQLPVSHWASSFHWMFDCSLLNAVKYLLFSRWRDWNSQNDHSLSKWMNCSWESLWLNVNARLETMTDSENQQIGAWADWCQDNSAFIYRAALLMIKSTN
jgi:hypothetical protein